MGRLEVVARLVASVVSVPVSSGQRVEEGDTLLVVESMKMEIPILAPAAGTLTALHAEVGEVVEEGDVLAIIDTG